MPIETLWPPNGTDQTRQLVFDNLQDIFRTFLFAKKIQNQLISYFLWSGFVIISISPFSLCMHFA